MKSEIQRVKELREELAEVLESLNLIYFELGKIERNLTKKKPKCFRCGRKGHIATNCRGERKRRNPTNKTTYNE